MSSQSYLTRSFTIDNPDARIRTGAALDAFVTGADGKPKTIPNGTVIKVKSVKTFPAGAKSVNIFVEALDSAGAVIGWTSATNLAGKFLSETLGEIPPPNGNKFGPNAAWANGAYLGQVTLVRVVGTGYEIEHISKAVCDAFLALVAAALKDGRRLAINSGFRTYAEQKNLYDGFKRGLPGYNPANPPGMSNHQNGIAFDFDVKPGGATPTTNG
jgi:D-alanyl-D-alanine carboxypeptidase